MKPALFLAVTLLAAPALADHAGSCEWTTSQPEFDSGDRAGVRVYVDNDIGMDWFSTWVYQETNGIDGLQRQDEVVDDTCGGQIEGDRIIF